MADSKLAFLPGKPISSKALLSHLLEESDDIEAVLCVVRREGSWTTTYGGAVDCGSLSLAALNALHTVMEKIHG